MRSKPRNIVRLSIMIGFISFFTAAEAQTVIQKLQSNRQTSHFARALAESDLDERLKNNGPFTLFAPSNSAFDKLSSAQQTNNNLLLNHVFTGMATERSLKAMSEVTCLSGLTISIKTDNRNQLSVNKFRVVTSNIRASNGVIHIIEGVIR